MGHDVGEALEGAVGHGQSALLGLGLGRPAHDVGCETVHADGGDDDDDRQVDEAADSDGLGELRGLQECQGRQRGHARRRHPHQENRVKEKGGGDDQHGEEGDRHVLDPVAHRGQGVDHAQERGQQDHRRRAPPSPAEHPDRQPREPRARHEDEGSHVAPGRDVRGRSEERAHDRHSLDQGEVAVDALPIDARRRGGHPASPPRHGRRPISSPSRPPRARGGPPARARGRRRRTRRGRRPRPGPGRCP